VPELSFAITQQQKSVLTGSLYGPLTRVLATLAVLAEVPHLIDDSTHTPEIWRYIACLRYPYNRVYRLCDKQAPVDLRGDGVTNKSINTVCM